MFVELLRIFTFLEFLDLGGKHVVCSTMVGCLFLMRDDKDWIYFLKIMQIVKEGLKKDIAEFLIVRIELIPLLTTLVVNFVGNMVNLLLVDVEVLRNQNEVTLRALEKELDQLREKVRAEHFIIRLNQKMRIIEYLLQSIEKVNSMNRKVKIEFSLDWICNEIANSAVMKNRKRNNPPQLPNLLKGGEHLFSIAVSHYSLQEKCEQVLEIVWPKGDAPFDTTVLLTLKDIGDLKLRRPLSDSDLVALWILNMFLYELSSDLVYYYLCVSSNRHLSMGPDDIVSITHNSHRDVRIINKQNGPSGIVLHVSEYMKPAQLAVFWHIVIGHVCTLDALKQQMVFCMWDIKDIHSNMTPGSVKKLLSAIEKDMGSESAEDYFSSMGVRYDYSNLLWILSVPLFMALQKAYVLNDFMRLFEETLKIMLSVN